MEKLIELLCEYEDVYNWFATCTIRGEKSKRELKSDYMLDEDQDIIQIYIISKQFGFIKWLVENDKIDINEEWDDYEKTNLYCNSDFFQLQKHYSYYESLLMLLAIQDEPIEFLISILK